MNSNFSGIPLFYNQNNILNNSIKIPNNNINNNQPKKIINNIYPYPVINNTFPNNNMNYFYCMNQMNYLNYMNYHNYMNYMNNNSNNCRLYIEINPNIYKELNKDYLVDLILFLSDNCIITTNNNVKFKHKIFSLKKESHGIYLTFKSNKIINLIDDEVDEKMEMKKNIKENENKNGIKENNEVSQNIIKENSNNINNEV